MYKLLFGALSLFASINCNGVEITFQNDTDCHKIFINGEIVKGDSVKLGNSIEYWKKIVDPRKCMDLSYERQLRISSRGGDVDEAMEMGKKIKESEFSVIVWTRDQCLSSCVFILAAGVTRNPTRAKIGIHRPYFGEMDDKLTMSQIRQKRDRLKLKIRDYFELMDIDPSLTEIMMQTPPEEIKILTKEELMRYRLSVDDANYDEKETAKQAKFYNITSGEYRKRNSSLNAKCGDSFSMNFSTCMESVLLNISTEEAARRQEKIRSLCREIPKYDDKVSCVKKYLIEGK